MVVFRDTKHRLVAKGHNQKLGFSYPRTFIPIVKSTTIRIILSLAISIGSSLRKLEFNNAFLNRDLSENVFVQQPPGFEISSNLGCKLHKSLYGLKQAPKA